MVDFSSLKQAGEGPKQGHFVSFANVEFRRPPAGCAP